MNADGREPRMNALQILAGAVVFVGITLILQSADFWVESLGSVLTATAAAYIGSAGASE